MRPACDPRHDTLTVHADAPLQLHGGFRVFVSSSWETEPALLWTVMALQEIHHLNIVITHHFWSTSACKSE